PNATQQIVSAKADEALRSLVARSLLTVSEGNAYADPRLLRMLELLCAGEWQFEAVTARGTVAIFDLRLAGLERAGVLATNRGLGCVRLSYRPDARLAAGKVLRALVADSLRSVRNHATYDGAGGRSIKREAARAGEVHEVVCRSGDSQVLGSVSWSVLA